MQAVVTFKVGEVSYQLNIDERGEMETLHKMIVLGNPPQYCKELPKGRFSLETNKDQEGNIYVNMVCKGKDESGEFKVYKAKLGQYKAGGYFWHGFTLDEYAQKRMQKNPQDMADDVEF